VFDGVAAAGGRLCVAMQEGRLLRLGEGGEPLPALE
jgi:hypothetical protein